LILKEVGPEIFVQSRLLIIPSGSLEAEPSNEMLSVGKVITWSGPALAVGGLFPPCIVGRIFLFYRKKIFPSLQYEELK